MKLGLVKRGKRGRRRKNPGSAVKTAVFANLIGGGGGAALGAMACAGGGGQQATSKCTTQGSAIAGAMTGVALVGVGGLIVALVDPRARGAGLATAGVGLASYLGLRFFAANVEGA